MGKADVNVNIWLSEKKRFANLFNGVIYGGENVILPEDLQVILTMLKYRKDKDGLRKSNRENKEHEKIPRYHYEMAESGYICTSCE